MDAVKIVAGAVDFEIRLIEIQSKMNWSAVGNPIAGSNTVTLMCRN